MITVHKVPESKKTGIIWYDMKAVLSNVYDQSFLYFEFQNRSFYISIQEGNTNIKVCMFILDDFEIVEYISLFEVDCSDIQLTDYAVYQFIQDILRTYNLDLIHDKTLETIKLVEQTYWRFCQIKNKSPEFVELDVQKNLESFDKLGASFQKIKEFYELMDTALQNI